MNNIPPKLQPVIDEFLKGLESINHEYITKNQDVDKKLSVIAKTTQSLKEQEKKNATDHKANQDKLDNEIDRYLRLQQELNAEIISNNSKQKGIESIQIRIDDKFKNTDAENKLAVSARTNLELATKKYKDKTQLLAGEFDLLDKKAIKIVDRERVVKSKELAMIKREEKLISDQHDISIREIDLKKKKERVELEMKRASVNV